MQNTRINIRESALHKGSWVVEATGTLMNEWNRRKDFVFIARTHTRELAEKIAEWESQKIELIDAKR
tara:strand:- start:432 stop:632 length:201 start_codon:yes stop_codon:yes gene_type:complete